jgi:heptaprenyl diphosphate synthase
MQWPIRSIPSSGSSRKLIITGLLGALALGVHAAEAQIPLLFPGVKPGFANAVSLGALVLLGWKSAFSITLLRVFVSFLLGGNLFAFACSLGGGLASLGVTAYLYRYVRHALSLPGISILGALTHNAAQIIVVAFLMHTGKVFLYLPILIFTGVLSGLCVGILASLLCTRLQRLGISPFRDLP